MQTSIINGGNAIILSAGEIDAAVYISSGESLSGQFIINQVLIGPGCLAATDIGGGY